MCDSLQTAMKRELWLWANMAKGTFSETGIFIQFLFFEP